MQDSENLSVRQYQTYTMGSKLFVFDSNLKFETYQNEWYYGIRFIIEDDGNGLLNKDGFYDVVHHYHMDWERLNISNKRGWNDIPFHAGTFGLLPEGVKVIEL